MGFEDQIPQPPNRDQELNYIKKVEKGFYDQPLYKFYMNEALRTKKMDYAAKLATFRYEWLLNFCYSGVIFTTLMLLPAAYSNRHTSVGTPFLYIPKGRLWKQEYKQARNYKRVKLYTLLVIGASCIYAHIYTDRSEIQDEYYTNAGVINPTFE